MALRERGHDVLVVSDQRPASLPADECVGGVRVLRFPFRRALIRDPVLFASLKSRIAALKREFRPDLAYIFSSGYGELFHYATSDDQPGAHVVTLHDSFEEERLRRRTIVGHNVRGAAWVTTCSRHVLDHTRRHVPEITADPAKLAPIRPRTFDLQVNVASAAAAGLTIPKEILDKASRVHGR
jgi:hypothetical protein